MGRKNIKVPEPLFMALRDDKGEQQSWPHYLEEQCLHDSADVQDLINEIAATVDGEGRVDDDGLAREVAAEIDYTELAGQVAKELEGRMR